MRFNIFDSLRGNRNRAVAIVIASLPPRRIQRKERGS